MINCGSFVISLDYELMWGMIDVAKKNGYGLTNVKNVPIVFDQLLELFERYDVHATVAVVGMIMYRNKEELLNDKPSTHPSYIHLESSPYENNYINDISKEEEKLFFQPEVVSKLKSAKWIEIATHTYCHYYCWEEGQTIEQFEVDIKKAVELAKSNDIEIKSIIFPRNNVSEEHLKICSKYGITSYRGNARKYFTNTKSTLQIYKNKILRTINTYINLSGTTTVPYYELRINSEMLNIPASRILKPYNKQLSHLEKIRLHRICSEMEYAAKNKEMYHIWWHPHNMGADIEGNIAFLEKILQCYKNCSEKYGMKSMTMNEIYNNLKQQ